MRCQNLQDKQKKLRNRLVGTIYRDRRSHKFQSAMRKVRCNQACSVFVRYVPHKDGLFNDLLSCITVVDFMSGE